MQRQRIISALAAICCLLAPTAGRAADPVDYQSEIHPILEKNCYECHGPKHRKGGLRLSNRSDAFIPGDSGKQAIVSGNADASVIIQKLTHADSEKRMPKDEAPLPQEQIELIRRWINAGAAWPTDNDPPPHWAYIPPVKAPLPEVKQKPWQANPIDHFILGRLDAAGLAPSPEEEPGRLIRRLSLDLTGLPPSVQLADRFIANPTDAEFEAITDELLASPRFGEHWAQQWLDLARYADSNGYQADQLRDLWAYRDWVINALNADMPFDQFTIEQLAGDLLPNATVSQKIATGFHRTVTCNVEAGVDPEENRVGQVFDRVTTTATTWMGSTFECAQCHNHKYDPITSRDYYRLFAYFNNTPIEVKQHSGVRYDFVGPKMNLPIDMDGKNLLSDLTARKTKLESELTARQQAAAERQTAWEAGVKNDTGAGPVFTVLPARDFVSDGDAEHQLLDDGSTLISGPNPDTDTYVVKVATTLKDVTGIRIEALTDPSLPGGTGPGRQTARDRGNFVLTDLSVTVAPTAATGTAQPLKLINPQASFAGKGYPIDHAIDASKETGWSIHGEWNQPHFATFQFENPVGDGSEQILTFRLEFLAGQQRQIGRLRLAAATGNFVGTPISDELRAIVARPAAKRTAKEKAEIAKVFADADSDLRKISKEIAEIDSEISKIEPPTTLVMVEMAEPRESHILKRGEFLSKGDLVTPGTPDFLPPPPVDAPANRLGLAKWLVSAANPLVGRVTINRWWYQMMGRGFVPSLEDLGTQSEPPTHPELLDWLAVDFAEQGWSMKHMLRLIVTSRAYRQASAISPLLADKDPQNLLFARGPRFRMSAEMIRDNGLATSGLLALRTGGDPIYPPQPEGTWRTIGRNAPSYVPNTDENRFRRGVYVIWRRSAPFVSYVNFDAPDRASCTVSRARTNTPLQALTLLNDTAYVEMALGLARRMTTEAGTSPDDRLRYGFRLCLSRQPTAAEMDLLRRTYAAGVAHYRERPEAARDLLQSNAIIKMPDQSATDLAAWFFVANVLFNLDEFITRG